MVRGPYGVAPHVLQDQKPAPKHIRIDCNPGRFIVLMDANTLDEHFLAVEFETLVHGEFQCPESQRGTVIVHQDISVVHLSQDAVHIGRVRRPKLRGRDTLGGGEHRGPEFGRLRSDTVGNDVAGSVDDAVETGQL